MKGETIAVSKQYYDYLGGGAFAMNRCAKYKYSIIWKEHCMHMGHRIMRAYHIDTGKPCALYGFIQNNRFLIVAESLGSIKDESRKVAGWGE